MRPLSSCTPGTLSHRRRPSLLPSVFPLAHLPSIPKKGMREVSGAPCPSCHSKPPPGLGRTRVSFGIRWHLLLFPILPIGTQVYMHLHTSTQIHMRSCMNTHPASTPRSHQHPQNRCRMDTG